MNRELVQKKVDELIRQYCLKIDNALRPDPDIIFTLCIGPCLKELDECKVMQSGLSKESFQSYLGKRIDKNDAKLKHWEATFEMQRDTRWEKKIVLDDDGGREIIPFERDTRFPLYWITVYKVIIDCLKYFFATDLAELLNDAPAPKSPQVFGDDLAAIVRPALAELKLLSDAGQFIGNPYQVKALYNVLKRRGHILGNAKAPDKAFADFFNTYFGFRVTDRTLRNPPSRGQDEAERKLLLMIQDKP